MPRIRLQQRDIDILHSLAVGRYLTVQAIEWLHFPTWWSRWQQHQASGVKAYYPLPNVYKRLEGLRAGGMVQSIKRTADRASLVFQRLADVYALTEAGADLLFEHRDLDHVEYTDTKKRSLTHLEHSVAIAMVYAALRSVLEAEFIGILALSGWQGDHQLARDYDRLVVAGHRAKLPVVPDATFTLSSSSRTRRYFVEVDRGTRPLSSWREKVQAYEAYRESTSLKERYDVKDFVLLVVAPTIRRVERIADWVAKYRRSDESEYAFITSQCIHPTTIRTGFQRIVSTSTENRVVAGRMQSVVTAILEQQPLWSKKESS